MQCILQQVSPAFQQWENFDNRLRFRTVTEFKAGNFFETQRRMLFYVNIYGSYRLSKNSPVFWPTLYFLVASDDDWCVSGVVAVTLWCCFYVYFVVCFQSHCGVKLQPPALGFLSLEKLVLDMKDSIEMTYKGHGKLLFASFCRLSGNAFIEFITDDCRRSILVSPTWLRSITIFHHRATTGQTTTCWS